MTKTRETSHNRGPKGPKEHEAGNHLLEAPGLQGLRFRVDDRFHRRMTCRIPAYRILFRYLRTTRGIEPMASKKKIYVTPKGSSNKRYYWYPSSGSVKRSPPGFFSSSRTIGSASSLEDAISLIKSHEGNVTKVDVR